MHVALLVPYLTGSHEAWATGYAAASRHRVRLLGMPGRFWKWRMHGAAVTMARRLAAAPPPDAVLTTDMLDVAAFRGLAGCHLASAPVVVYFHENQLAYPAPPPEPDWSPSRRRRSRRRDFHYPFINLTTALAADAAWWNSRFNRDSFLEALPRFLRRLPDEEELGLASDVAARSTVMPLGLDLRSLEGAATVPRGGRPRIIWNHRWEHDKDPAAFVAALDALVRRGVDFDVAVLGRGHGSVPASFEGLRNSIGDRLAHFGFVADRREYGAWLRSGDVVVSTARQEFFGAAVWEAVWCGCRPVLPDRLVYPEMVPGQHQAAVLYRGSDGLVDGLAQALARPDPDLVAALRRQVAALDWQEVASRYDGALEALVEATAGPGAAS